MLLVGDILAAISGYPFIGILFKQDSGSQILMLDTTESDRFVVQ
jgi:hypothetical protein